MERLGQGERPGGGKAAVMPDTTAAAAPAGLGPDRFAVIDMVRGVAILLMIVYHFSWDLTYFGLARFAILTDPAWIWFARSIAALILLVMGVSQVMARRRGLTSRAFLKRLCLIAACAAAVSAATYWMAPGAYVFFGILHHIALASLLMVGLIALPTAALIALAAAALAAPFALSGPAFTAGWLLWLGLAPEAPLSVDYVPLLPWLAVPLTGVILGRLLVGNGDVPGWLTWRPADPLGRLVRFAGRHSLAVYMLHQPVLFGGLYVIVSVFGR